MTMTRFTERPLSRLARFGRREDGVAAIEFAFIAPLLVVFLLGTTTATQSLWAHGKVAQAGSVIGDLVTQETDLDDATLLTIMKAAPILIEPFPVGNMTIKITAGIACHEDPDDTEGKTPIIFVVWSNGWKKRGLTNRGQRPGAMMRDAPENLSIQDGDYIVKTEVKYTYSPSISQKAGHEIEMVETAYHQPRSAKPISYPSREESEQLTCRELMDR